MVAKTIKEEVPKTTQVTGELPKNLLGNKHMLEPIKYLVKGMY